MTEPLTPADMAALHAACFTAPRPWSAAEFAGLMADPLVQVLTAPGGMLLTRIVAGEAEILTLAVAPEARRTGIARRLLDRFHALAEARQVTAASLEVATDNIAATSLYMMAGYQAAGLRRGYYGQNGGPKTDALVLVKTFGEA